MNNKKNILLLSAGRRVGLARAFQAVAEAYGALFIAADMRPHLSAACQDSSHAVELPHVDAVEYPDTLARICRDYRIGLVVPTIDTELAKLASLRESFYAEGTNIIVSSSELITIARDKRLTADYFNAFQVPSPTVYSEGTIQYPAIAKPFDGSLSRDVHILRAPADYTEKVSTIPNLMLAQYISADEYDEFTCDAYYDKGGILRCIVPRQRIEVRGGEVSKGRTARNNIVKLFETQLWELKGARGCMTFQFFRNRHNGEILLIELNARFGGGFPLSLAAGADYPRWLYEEWILGKPVQEYTGWTDSLTMLRYDAEILVKGDPGR